MGETNKDQEKEKPYSLEWLLVDQVFEVHSKSKPGIFTSPDYGPVSALKDALREIHETGYKVLSLTSISTEDHAAVNSGDTDGFIGVVEKT